LLGVSRVGFCDRQRADDQPAVADLVPVVFASDPTAIPVVHLQSGLQAVLDKAGLDFLAHVRVQIGIQPVIAKADCVGHFSRIEKMRWIPVLEGADGQQVIDRLFGVLFLAGPSVSEAKSVDATQTLSADMEKPWPDLPVSEHRLSGAGIRLIENVLEILLQNLIFHMPFF
jgi:hypothetical protein